VISRGRSAWLIGLAKTVMWTALASLVILMIGIAMIVALVVTTLAHVLSVEIQVLMKMFVFGY
jgi:hypothetical protein